MNASLSPSLSISMKTGLDRIPTSTPLKGLAAPVFCVNGCAIEGVERTRPAARQAAATDDLIPIPN